MLTAASAFALFVMLALASIVYFVSTKLKLPYTVLLTFTGILLVPLSALEPFGFIQEFSLTPELLFYIFLPTLLFESAYNMHIRRIMDEFSPIMLLAIVGYLLSAILIGFMLWAGLALVGVHVPMIVTLLFGALISATDPVAVLALFKEYGAPQRLTLIFEGESLANDATALAFFLVVLSLIESGITAGTVAEGGLTFMTMLVGGAIVGLVVGTLLIWLIGVFRKNEFVAITLMIVLAHLTFLVSELLNEYTHELGIAFLKFSPIIATSVASILMGSYGRFKVTPAAEEFVDKFWTQFAFMANSIVFLLVGLLFASVPDDAGALIVPIIIAIVVVAFARALSVYGTLIPFNLIAGASAIPWSWMHLLSWGSLRGALAVMLVLLIPPDLSIPGWTLSVTIQEFLLVLTVGCIFATLFIKAPTIGPLMRRLKADTLSPLEEVSREKARALIYGAVVQKLNEFIEKGYVPKSVGKRLQEEYNTRYISAYGSEHTSPEGEELVERALGMYTIGLEKEVLKELLAFDEVTERVFKRIYGKLTLQGEAIEKGEKPHASQIYDWRDVFERAAEFIRGYIVTDTEHAHIHEQYLYYRAQEILARKVLKELRYMNNAVHPAFVKAVLEKTMAAYEIYRAEANAKLAAICAHNPKHANVLGEALAARSVFRVEEKIIEKLQHRGLLTPKLYIALKEEFDQVV